jgi:hypothetical protein
LLIDGVILAGISIIWTAIFLRDTGGLLPLSTSPGYNPQYLEQTSVFYQTSLLSQLTSFWRGEGSDPFFGGNLPGVPTAASLTVLGLVICGWLSVSTKHGAAIRNEFVVLGAFLTAAVATVVGLMVMIGPKALTFQRYYFPVVDGVLYVFLIRSVVHLLQRGPGRLSTYASLPIAGMTAVLCVAVLMSAENLSVPSESAGQICSQLLSPEERREFEQIPVGSRDILLAINCPIGSFEISQRVMMNDLFSATRGYYFDITSDAKATARWLQTQGVDQLVYLDNDQSDTYSVKNWRSRLEILTTSGCSLFPCESVPQRKMEYSYWLESLAKFRDLAQYCGSVRVPIRDPQGPLVVVDVRQCENRE